MKLFVFVCKNTTNIWAGIGSSKWAVSSASSPTMKARATKAKSINVGNAGLIYHSGKKALTTPFIFMSQPDPNKTEEEIWPEHWSMPFSIQALGNPRKFWDAHEAASTLPFNKETGNRNISSVFNALGTAVFSPVEVGDEDWAMILEKLSSSWSV